MCPNEDFDGILRYELISVGVKVKLVKSTKTMFCKR